MKGSEELNQNKLAERAIAGDEDCFTELIDGMQERLYRMAFTYVRNKDEALEIVQETVFKAFISIHKLQQPQYFRTWITKIAVNCALDYIRKSSKIVYMDKDPEGSYAQEHSEENIDLHKALSGLDEKSRIIIVMRYFEDLPIKEIAVVMGMPVSSVKSVLYRGLEKLKINLEESEYFG